MDLKEPCTMTRAVPRQCRHPSVPFEGWKQWPKNGWDGTDGIQPAVGERFDGARACMLPIHLDRSCEGGRRIVTASYVTRLQCTPAVGSTQPRSVDCTRTKPHKVDRIKGPEPQRMSMPPSKSPWDGATALTMRMFTCALRHCLFPPQVNSQSVVPAFR